MLDFLVVLETMYLSVDVIGNKNIYNNLLEGNIGDVLNKLRERAEEEGSYILFDNGTLFYECLPKGIDRYKFGFSVREHGETFPILWIYIARKIGDNYPIYVKISSRYLHLHDINYVLNSVKTVVYDLIKIIDNNFYTFVMDKPYLQKLSRIDICIHNKLFNINDYFKSIEDLNTRVVTSIGLDKRTGKRNVKLIAELDGEYDFTIPYIMYMGKSVKLRMYNKIKEVIEMRNKTFFLPYWRDKGLISDLEFNIYDDVLKYTEDFNDYRVCFLLAHILRFVKNQNERIKAINLLLSRAKRDKIYSEFMKIIIKNNINLVAEVVNIEYELHNTFLKTIKILDKETGNLIDFTNPADMLNNINLLYEYLTKKIFRIIDKNSKAKRKRAKKVDKLWKEIQQQKVMNVNDVSIKNDNLVFYREYSKLRDKSNIIRTWINKSSSLLYHLSEEISLNNLEDIDYIEFLNNSIENILRNDENYLLFRYDLAKKIKSYGDKKKNPLKGNDN